MAEWTNQKPFIVKQSHVDASWNGRKDDFRCAWCGHRFRVGDVARWVFTNTGDDAKHVPGNLFICASCDVGSREEILQQLIDIGHEFRHPRFWWWRR